MDFIIGVDDPPPTYAQIIEDTEEQRQESDFIPRKIYVLGFIILKRAISSILEHSYSLSIYVKDVEILSKKSCSKIS